ncbi:MAG: hypothetical protein RQ875_07790 [Vicingaceae bacterium]|nr:hypothetical protein [Vicingaceae bacterium]
MRLAAKIISILFNPLLMPTIGLFLLFNTDTYINYAVHFKLKQFTILLVALVTFIIPLLSVLFLRNRGVITSIEMYVAKERIIPYIITIVSYIFTLYILRQTSVIPIVFNFIIGATYAIILAFIINIKWKISAHAIGIGGLLGAFLCVATKLQTDVSIFIIALLVVFGLVATARLILNAHTQAQIYAGFLLGIATQFAVFYL